MTARIATPDQAAPRRAVLPRMSLGTSLVAAMLVASVPVALLLAWQALDRLHERRERIDGELRRSSHALALSVQRELVSTTDLLQALAHTLATQRSSPQDGAAALRRTLAGQPVRDGWRSIHLLGPDGTVLFDSAAAVSLAPLAPTAPLPPLATPTPTPPEPRTTQISLANAAPAAAPEAAPATASVPVDLRDGRELRASGQRDKGAAPEISDLVVGLEWAGTAVRVPFVAQDGKRYRLGAWVDAGHWQELVAGAGPPEGGMLSLFDGEHRLIARSNAPGLTGRSLSPRAIDAIEALEHGSGGVQRVDLPEGGIALSAWDRPALSRWSVAAQLPAAPLEQAERSAVVTALAAAATCLLLGVALAMRVARRVTAPLNRLAAGLPLAGAPAVREIALLDAALVAAQEREALSRAHLQRKADDFQALFAGTPIGLAFTTIGDSGAGPVLHNAAMDALVGPAASATGGRDDAAPVEVRHHGRVLRPNEQPLQRAIVRGEPVGSFEFELRYRSGATRHVLARAMPLLDRAGRVRGAVAAMVDITERKRAETRVLEADERLRESQRLVDLAQEAGDVGFFQYRFDNGAATWTPGQARLFGLDAGRGPLSPQQMLELVHADDREGLVARLRQTIADKRERQTFEFRVHAAGERQPQWLSTRMLLAYGADGQPRQLVGVSFDITEHKAAEEARTALTAIEQRARVAAESASRAKDEFLAMLGHELRNPLAAIASAVEVLKRLHADAPLAANARQIITRQTRHLARLMDDLLDVGRVIAGKASLARCPLELATLVRRVVGNFEVTGATRRHALTLSLGEVRVDADATRLEQVVSNLLGNAFKYTPEGGTVEVVLAEREGQAVLEVRDNGPGIPATLLPHVFELFVQGERPLDRRVGGLGIGLTLVRRIVELHGGQVGVESSGAGSTFTVRLPALPASAAAPTAAPRRSAQALRRIVVVEDNDDARTAMCTMLELDGHRVSTAADGEKGLALLLSERPDAAVVDIGLPGLSGYEIARQCRRAGYAGWLLALSGYGGEKSAHEARRHGFDAHLAKPVDPEQLRELLAQAA